MAFYQEEALPYLTRLCISGSWASGIYFPTAGDGSGGGVHRLWGDRVKD